MLKVYEVISTNLDIQDGYFCNVLFRDLESAKERCKKEIDILSNSEYPGKWDIWHLRQSNQLPNPPKQLTIQLD